MSKRTKASGTPPWIPKIVSSCSQDRRPVGSPRLMGRGWCSLGRHSVPVLTDPGVSCFTQGSFLSIPLPKGKLGRAGEQTMSPMEERGGEREVEEVANPRRGGTLCTFVYI